MASGSWEFGTSNQYIKGRIRWSSSSNGSAANSSKVTVYLDYKKSSSTATYGTIKGTLCGSSYSKSVTLSSSSGYINVASKSWTQGHNSDGSKTITISANGGISGTTFSSSSTSKNVTLDKIPRYTSIKTWSVAEVGKTYVKLKWETADTIDWLRVYLNDSSQWTDNPGSQNGTSGSFIYTGAASSGASIPSVSTLNPGTKYKIKCWVRRKDSQLSTTSSNIEFTTQSVASISNISDNFSYNIGDNLTINFSNSSINKSWLSLEIENTSGVFEEVLKTDEAIQSDSYTWQLSSYASTLFSKMPTRNTARCKIKCGTTIVENSQTINYVVNEYVGTINVTNSNPIFSDFNYGDENSSTQKVLGNSAYMLQNYGAMVLRIPTTKKATAKNGAYIVKYIIQLRGVGYVDTEKSYSDSSEVSLVLGSFNSTGSGTISIYAVDSRGNTSGVVSKTFTVLSYFVPGFSSFNLKRLNDYEAEVVLDFTGVISKLTVAGTEKNTTRNIGYRYAELGTSYPSNFTAIGGVSVSSDSSKFILTFAQNTQDNTFGISGVGSSKLILSNNKAYNFQFYIQDGFTTSYYEFSIEQGIPIMFIGDNDQVSIGAVPDITRTEKLQVGSDIMATDNNGNQVGILDAMTNIFTLGEEEPENQMIGYGIWCKDLGVG